ncbi:MAG: type II toxin-antitoxin system HicA family toxin [Patescibacteria group bacterium]
MRKTVRVKELVRILEKHGFVLDRQVGSHAHYRHGDGRWTTIPAHNGDIRKGTLHAILKDVGMTLDDLD